jgi:two-component system response regulator
MANEAISRIVIVDDDPDDAYMLQRAITNAAISTEVKILDDGAAFVDFYSSDHEIDQTQRRQLVLLDINMPILSGFEALHALEEMGARRHAPILMFSTSCEPVDVTRAYELGVNGYVKKPCTVEEAQRTVVALNAFWLETNIAIVPRTASDGHDYPRRF